MSEISFTSQPISASAAASIARLRPRLADQHAVLGAMAELVPQLLGDERHHRMQELHRSRAARRR
jgi:hypothetical protein